MTVSGSGSTPHQAAVLEPVHRPDTSWRREGHLSCPHLALRLQSTALLGSGCTECPTQAACAPCLGPREAPLLPYTSGNCAFSGQHSCVLLGRLWGTVLGLVMCNTEQRDLRPHGVHRPVKGLTGQKGTKHSHLHLGRVLPGVETDHLGEHRPP